MDQMNLSHLINQPPSDDPRNKLDEDMIVTFRRNKCRLGEAIDNCRPGESIEGVPIEMFDVLLYRFEKDRGKKFQNSVDRRYGEWRFILFDTN